jgi:hypothetical protein
LYFCSGSRGAA